MHYPGGKGKSYQQIINLIPPHKTFIEAFLGGGAVIRHKRPALRNIGIEIDPIPLKIFTAPYSNIELICKDSIEYLESISFNGNELIYCDPPYFPTTRRRNKVYRYDFNESDHVRLLKTLNRLPCKILISGYDNKLYQQELSKWSKFSFNAKTHHGVRQECVWFNYELPSELHDTRYLGSNYRERQNIKRRTARLKQKIECLSPPEQSHIRQWMLSRTD